MTDKELLLKAVEEENFSILDKDRIYWFKINFPEDWSLESRCEFMTRVSKVYEEQGVYNFIISDGSRNDITIDDITDDIVKKVSERLCEKKK